MSNVPLTQEQRDRIERNRQDALRKRQEAMHAARRDFEGPPNKIQRLNGHAPTLDSSLQNANELDLSDMSTQIMSESDIALSSQESGTKFHITGTSRSPEKPSISTSLEGLVLALQLQNRELSEQAKKSQEDAKEFALNLNKLQNELTIAAADYSKLKEYQKTCIEDIASLRKLSSEQDEALLALRVNNAEVVVHARRDVVKAQEEAKLAIAAREKLQNSNNDNAAKVVALSLENGKLQEECKSLRMIREEHDCQPTVGNLDIKALSKQLDEKDGMILALQLHNTELSEQVKAVVGKSSEDIKSAIQIRDKLQKSNNQYANQVSIMAVENEKLKETVTIQQASIATLQARIQEPAPAPEPVLNMSDQPIIDQNISLETLKMECEARGIATGMKNIHGGFRAEYNKTKLISILGLNSIALCLSNPYKQVLTISAYIRENDNALRAKQEQERIAREVERQNKALDIAETNKQYYTIDIPTHSHKVAKTCNLRMVTSGYKREKVATCQVCRGKGSCVYTCELCDFDICNPCHLKESEQIDIKAFNTQQHTVVIPLHVHKVARTSDIRPLKNNVNRMETVVCYNCRMRGSQYCCLSCNWDICNKCYISECDRLEKQKLRRHRLDNWTKLNNVDVAIARKPTEAETSLALYCGQDGCGSSPGLQCKNCYGHYEVPKCRNGHSMPFTDNHYHGSPRNWVCSQCSQSTDNPPATWQAFLGPRYWCSSCNNSICIDCVTPWIKRLADEKAHVLKVESIRNRFKAASEAIFKRICKHATKIHGCKVATGEDIKHELQTRAFEGILDYDETIAKSIISSECNCVQSLSLDQTKYHCPQCDISWCEGCYQSDVRFLEDVYGSRKFDKDTRKEKFDEKYKTPKAANVSLDKILAFVVWSGIERNSYNRWDNDIDDPNTFDSSWPTIQDANLRARFIFFYQNDQNLSVEEIGEHNRDQVDFEAELNDQNLVRLKMRIDTFHNGESDDYFRVCVDTRERWNTKKIGESTVTAENWARIHRAKGLVNASTPREFFESGIRETAAEAAQKKAAMQSMYDSINDVSYRGMLITARNTNYDNIY